MENDEKRRNNRGRDPIVRPNTGGNPGRNEPLQFNRKRREIYWGECDTGDIGKLVAATCDKGRGLILGRTTDGGALSITILDGESRIREYPTTVQDFEELVSWCVDNF